MPFKKIFFVWKKNDHDAEWKKKIASLELEMGELKKTISNLEEEKLKESHQRPKDPPIIIEKINIEKIVLDKYELNNNFGQLGIKELTGKLNIGATYGADFTPMLPEEADAGKSEGEERVKEQPFQGVPRVNIKTKQED